MLYRREAYREGIDAVIEVQERHRKRLTLDASKLVAKKIVKQVGLKGDPREYYFYLWAVCALRSQEAMCRNWKKTWVRCKSCGSKILESKIRRCFTCREKTRRKKRGHVNRKVLVVAKKDS